MGTLDPEARKALAKLRSQLRVEEAIRKDEAATKRRNARQMSRVARSGRESSGKSVAGSTGV